MAQKFCTTCGAALYEGKKFCEQCGSPVFPDTVAPYQQAPDPAAEAPVTASSVTASEHQKRPGSTIIIAVLILIVIGAGVIVLVLPSLQGQGMLHGLIPAPATTIPVQATSTPLPTTFVVTTAIPAQTQEPFPGALHMKDKMTFGSGPVESEASVYRFWINDTYEWHNDKDNHYYVQKPSPGSKFLFVFVHLQNIGDTRVWFPPSSSVRVYYRGSTYSEDRSHFKPDKVADEKSAPVEVREVMYFPKLNGDEYAEDYGFSHGTELAYLYPGASNAVDGYIIYQVPQALSPEETYVTIPFNGKDSGVWRLG